MLELRPPPTPRYQNQCVPAKLVLGGEWIFRSATTWDLVVNKERKVSIWVSETLSPGMWYVKNVPTEVVTPGVEGLRAAMHIAEVMVMTGAV